MYIPNWLAVLFMLLWSFILVVAMIGWLYSADQNEKIKMEMEMEIQRLKRKNKRLQEYVADQSAILEAAEIPYPGGIRHDT